MVHGGASALPAGGWTYSGGLLWSDIGGHAPENVKVGVINVAIGAVISSTFMEDSIATYVPSVLRLMKAC